MGRTCGEPDEIKKNTHPKSITAVFRDQFLVGLARLLQQVARALHVRHHATRAVGSNQLLSGGAGFVCAQLPAGCHRIAQPLRVRAPIVLSWQQ